MPRYQLCSFQNLAWFELMINKKGRGVPEQLPNACILRFNECPRWVKCVPFIQSSMQMSGCHKNATVLCSWVVVVVLQRNIDTWLWFCTTNRLTDRQTDRPTKEVTNHRLCDYTVEDVLMNTTFVKCVVKSKEAFIILIVHLNMKCNVWVCVWWITHKW